MTDAIARLKITLKDMEPAVIRRVEMPFDIRLDRLHLLIQAAMPPLSNRPNLPLILDIIKSGAGLRMS